MDSSTNDRNPFDRLAEEFALRVRRGERPRLTEYTDSYPELADEIHNAFPAIIMIERLKPQPDDSGRLVPSRSAIPERLGDYRILREIGRGGMGVVYEAEQVSLGRHVALRASTAAAAKAFPRPGPFWRWPTIVSVIEPNPADGSIDFATILPAKPPNISGLNWRCICCESRLKR